MNVVFAALMVSTVIVLSTACFPELDPSIKVTSVNETPSSLCFNLYEPSAEYCSKVKASGKTVWRPQCGGNQTLVFILTVGKGGPTIYDKPGTCDDWKNTTITIKQAGDAFVVTDDVVPRTSSPTRLQPSIN